MQPPKKHSTLALAMLAMLLLLLLYLLLESRQRTRQIDRALENIPSIK